ncbi:ADP-ribosylation factor-like protein 2-binding protein [Nelusetta ayraudi]|uniref:ADP-ribosylation factor-like protein 2-binding protein n=1 Tax=Nelusetta ayraudi TaxID=303726 RepID=UPI003F70CCCA
MRRFLGNNSFRHIDYRKRINLPSSLNIYFNTMDIRERLVQPCGENVLEVIEMDEENFASTCSSAADTAFDAVIGFIEDIIMNEEFRLLQQNFMDKHYLEFEDSEENKLSYTTIFNDYISLLEKHLEQQLTLRIPGFNMNNFTELLLKNKDDVPGDIFDMLLTFTDFIAFKEMFLDYRREKEGRGLDLSQGLVVTLLVPSAREQTGSNESQ